MVPGSGNEVRGVRKMVPRSKNVVLRERFEVPWHGNSVLTGGNAVLWNENVVRAGKKQVLAAENKVLAGENVVLASARIVFVSNGDAGKYTEKARQDGAAFPCGAGATARRWEVVRFACIPRKNGVERICFARRGIGEGE